MRRWSRRLRICATSMRACGTITLPRRADLPTICAISPIVSTIGSEPSDGLATLERSNLHGVDRAGAIANGHHWRVRTRARMIAYDYREMRENAEHVLRSMQA